MDTAILIVGIVNGVLLAVILIRMYLGKDRTDPASLIASVKEGLAGPQRELREEVSGSVQTSVCEPSLRRQVAHTLEVALEG